MAVDIGMPACSGGRGHARTRHSDPMRAAAAMPAAPSLRRERRTIAKAAIAGYGVAGCATVMRPGRVRARSLRSYMDSA